MKQNLQDKTHHFGHVKSGHVSVHFLVILFGISTWIGVNGVYVKLPLLVNIAPEGWHLATYIIIVTQSANIGPAIYTLLHRSKCKSNESLCILCLLCLQILAIGLLIFFYDKPITIGNEKHSLILLVSVFLSGLVGCFGSVLFMPYLHDFNDIYITSYFIGEGLSGVLPSIAALTQDVREYKQCTTTPNNTIDTPVSKSSAQYYFVFLTAIVILSLVAFIVLQYSPFVQDRKNLSQSNSLFQTKVQLVNYKQRGYDIAATIYYINGTESIDHVSFKEGREIDCSRINEVDNPVFKKIYLYILIGICSFFHYGFLPSIKPYSCLPYGNLAYLLSVTCAQFVHPLAYFLTFWFTVSNIKVINYLSLVFLIFGCYVICIASLSPTPPLQGLKIGIILIVLSWIILVGVLSYLKLTIVYLLKYISSSKALFNIGIVMQAGAASGAIISFILINFTNCFKAYNPCTV